MSAKDEIERYRKLAEGKAMIIANPVSIIQIADYVEKLERVYHLLNLASHSANSSGDADKAIAVRMKEALQDVALMQSERAQP